jgi:c-di-GMP-binding flagellar brake protein YcgR/CheY-like chemotaxis protein
MKFQALLLIDDDGALEVLSQALAEFQIEAENPQNLDAIARLLDEKHFDQVVVDFDDRENASRILEAVRHSSSSKNAVAVGLISGQGNVGAAFGTGANFVLYKPVSTAQAQATFRAATALLRRERRRTFRVPVQLPVTLTWEGVPQAEGIILDLSEDGMDVLSAQPLQELQTIDFRFSLPDSTEIQARGQVAWANPNGQSGVRFTKISEEECDQLCAWLNANAPEAPPEDEPLSQCRLSDLSLGGCYVETESPFPARTKIDLCLRASNLEVHAEGVVRVMHPSYGMGVEFASRTGAQREQVEHFIDFLTSQPGVMPQLLVSPKSINLSGDQVSTSSESDDLEDPLLHLLRTENNLSQDEFLAELRRQRRSEAEASLP